MQVTRQMKSPYKNPTDKLVLDMLEMQKQFRNSESQFLEFAEIVPYTNNPLNIYSPKMVSLLLYLGPQILGMFEILKKQNDITCGDTFGSYYDALNKKGMLSCQGFILNDSALVGNPFNDRDPKWWQTYNHHVKHMMPSGIFEATYQNVIEAIGALFILHHIVDTKQRKLNPVIENADILDQSNWLKVHTVGNYIHYKTATSLNSSLFESFLSHFIRIDKRFLPHLKEHKVEPKYD